MFELLIRGLFDEKPKAKNTSKDNTLRTSLFFITRVHTRALDSNIGKTINKPPMLCNGKDGMYCEYRFTKSAFPYQYV